jgi:hypothetical protein
MPVLANLPPGGQRYLATKYLLSLADGEKGLRKAIILLRENITARNQAAMGKSEEAGNGASGAAGAAAGAGEQPAPGSKRRPAKGGRRA